MVHVIRVQIRHYYYNDNNLANFVTIVLQCHNITTFDNSKPDHVIINVNKDVEIPAW